MAARKIDLPASDVAPGSASDPGIDRSRAAEAPKRSLKISTVSHTLEETIAERLRYFAFRERISESAVIEFALRVFFEDGNDAALGEKLRASGAALRRKS